MNRFIKLTSIYINIKHISTILIKPNKYYFYLASNKIDSIIAINSMVSDKTEIIICENKNPKDYKIVSDWLSKK